MKRHIASIFIVTALVGCADDTPLAPIDEARAVDAAVDVRTSGCGPREGFGTGTLIDHRLIVTAAHVVSGKSDVTTIDAQGTRRAADVVLLDPDLDIAVLRSSSDHPQEPMRMRPTLARAGEVGIAVLPNEEDGIAVIDVIDVEIIRRARISTTDIYLEDDVIRPGFEVAGSISPGDSGAMVVIPGDRGDGDSGDDDDGGGGVGIVWARSTRNEDRAWAIDLPPEITDESRRAELLDAEPVDVGRCVPQ